MCDFDGATRVVGLLAPLAKSIWVITTFALVVLKVLLKNYLWIWSPKTLCYNRMTPINPGIVPEHPRGPPLMRHKRRDQRVVRLVISIPSEVCAKSNF